MYAGSASSRDLPSSPIFFLSFLLLGMGKRGGYEADGSEQLNVSDRLRASRSGNTASKVSVLRAVPCRSLLHYRPQSHKTDQGYKSAKMNNHYAQKVVMFVANVMLCFVNVYYILRLLLQK